jgi:hypothetical protein
MGLKNSGKLDERAAPYFRVYPAATATDVDLTEAVEHSKCATSLLICHSAAGGDLVIEDATGTEVTMTLAAGTHNFYIAAVRLDAATTVDVMACWHPRPGAA